MSLAVSTVSDPGPLRALEPEWDDLVRAMPRPSPFLLNAWLGAWWESHSDRGELSVHVAHRNGRLCGALPLYVRHSGGLRVVEFIGGRDAHLADMLLAPGENGDVARALVRRAAAHDGDLADLFGLPRESRLLGALGGSVRVLERVESPVLDLGGDWDGIYAAHASSKTRQTHRRKERRLGDVGRVDFELASTVDEIDAILDETFRVHELRWNGRPDGSEISTSAGRAVQRAGYCRLAEQGIARILALRVDGTVVAFNAYLVLARRLYLHRLAFDPSYGRWSPGLLCTLRMCELAAEEELERIEFLGGDEDYKLMLADRLEPMHQAVGLARTLRGRATAVARVENVLLRQRLKRLHWLRKLYFEGLAPGRRAVSRVRAIFAAR